MAGTAVRWRERREKCDVREREVTDRHNIPNNIPNNNIPIKGSRSFDGKTKEVSVDGQTVTQCLIC